EFNLLLFYGAPGAARNQASLLAKIWVVPRSKEDARQAPAPGSEEPSVASEPVGAPRDLSAIERLGRLLSTGDQPVPPENTAKTLEMLGTPEALAGLRHLLEDPDEQVRNTVVEALGALADREMVRLLQRVLEDPGQGSGAEAPTAARQAR